MGQFRRKSIVVEAVTFDEFIEIGKKFSGNEFMEIPWFFLYNGHPVTHDDDNTYLIPTPEGVYKFTRDHVLITGIKGEIYPCKIDIFNETYEKI